MTAKERVEAARDALRLVVKAQSTLGAIPAGEDDHLLSKVGDALDSTHGYLTTYIRRWSER